MQAVLSSIGEVVYDWDLVSDRILWGPNAAAIFGAAELAELGTGRGYAAHLAAESPSSRYEVVTGSDGCDIGAGVPFQVTYGLVFNRRTGSTSSPPIWIEDIGRWFVGPHNRPARAHGIVRIITARYEAERKQAWHSNYDALTGAVSRARFVEQTSALVAGLARKPGSFALLLAGIDDLFGLNRTFGYDVGDEIVTAVATLLRAHMRASDVIARYAGNKFALLLDACDWEQMQIAAQRFLAAVETQPIATSVGDVSVSLRLGGVICPQHGRTAQILLRNAEEALTSARQSYATHFVAYQPELIEQDTRMKALRVRDEIVSALNQSRILMAVQPIVSATTGQIVLHEALLRLDNANGALLAPATILPIAEKAGLIQLIDHRMLDLAVAHLAQDPNLQLAINASAATVHDPSWPLRLEKACALYPSIAGRLMIEITETCFIADLQSTQRAIAAMKSCGLRVAMDDFGAGHTSFRSLRALDIDLLKIDGAFVQNLAHSSDDRFFVRTLVELARYLGIATVAEWVEDAESARILADWGVDYLQGHLFGKAELRPLAAVVPQAVA